MSKNLIITLVVVGCIVVGGIVLASTYFSTVGREARLVNSGTAQQTACKVVFDKTWKTMEGKVQVLSAYREDMMALVLGEMTQRYQGETKQAPIFKFIQEHNLGAPTELYKEVMDCIEANRAEFVTEQKKLADIKREHDDMLVTPPWNMFLAGKKPLEIVIITSAKTKEVYRTGEDNDVDLGLTKKK